MTPKPPVTEADNNSPQLKFDEVGLWSELKLEIVEKYGAAYTNGFANQSLKKILHRCL